MLEVVGTWRASVMTEAWEVFWVDGPRCTLDLVEDGPEDAL